jgi:Tol biopolymer transport system component
LTPERWAQIEELFHRVLECDPKHRPSVMEEVCGNDPELRRELESLLSGQRTASNHLQGTVRVGLEALAFPLVGETISHYRLLDALGSGGMGLVYLAEDLKLSRKVALKFLPEGATKDPAALARFEREACSASALEHPNICPIYEFGEHEGRPFIVMQLLEGQTLRELISSAGPGNPPLEIERLLNLAIQITEGLGAAHKRGIIHRDIKPANIFVTSQGQAKILDFGLAKLAPMIIALGNDSKRDDRDDEAANGTPHKIEIPATPNLFLSRTGVAMGTAGYMSPEQVRGEKLDARTDLFSFGLVLYEMATGRRAFKGDTGPALQEAILKELPTPARGVNPDVPARLETIINKALERDRAARFQTASALQADLEDLQRQLASKHLPRAWAVGLGAAAAIALATILFVLSRPPKRVSVAPEIKMRQLTTNSSENPVANGAISPDGSYLAYIDTHGMHIKFIDTGETRTVPKPEALKDQSVKWENGIWFPDSNRLLVNLHPANEEMNSATNSIWVVSVLGGAPAKLRDHAIAWSVSPDGSLVSFGTNSEKLGKDEVWLMGPNGEQARKFEQTDAHCCLYWSPDGKQYLYISEEKVVSRNVKGGPPVTLFQPSELAKMGDLVALHDGRVLSSPREATNDRTCNYWTMRIDLSTGRQLEEPRRLTNWPNFCAFGGSVTSNDKRLAFVASSGFYTSYVADLEAGGKRLRSIRRFTLEDADNFVVGWTADGKVMVAQDRDTWSLYKQSLDSDTPEPIVSSVAGGALLKGAITPDGKWYIGRIWPNGESIDHPTIPFPILRIPLAGGAPETILQLSRQGKVSCARPPSNTCVLAEQSEDRKQMIVSMLDPIKGRGPELFRFEFDRELAACVVSPDGTRLAITQSPLEIRSLYGRLIYKIPSQSLGELIWLNWSADQKGFFVTRKGQSGNELLYLDFQGKATSLWKCGGGTNGVGGGCEGSPSPDGRHLAIDDKNQSNNMWIMENF